MIFATSSPTEFEFPSSIRLQSFLLQLVCGVLHQAARECAQLFRRLKILIQVSPEHVDSCKHGIGKLHATLANIVESVVFLNISKLKQLGSCVQGTLGQDHQFRRIDQNAAEDVGMPTGDEFRYDALGDI